MEIIGFALCLDNSGYEVSLEVRKMYPVVEPLDNDPTGYLRIVDESDEDYLYSEKAFAIINLSPQIEKRIKKSLSSVQP
jgi:hypothetical protein